MKLVCIINGHWWKNTIPYDIASIEGIGFVVNTTYQSRDCVICKKSQYRTVKCETIGIDQ
jgi:hypothetical protein